jgi:hypothetical protein
MYDTEKPEGPLEILVHTYIYQTARHHIPEHRNLQERGSSIYSSENKAISSSETLVPFYQTTRRRTEENNVQDVY